jgi:hypothetical protein
MNISWSECAVNPVFVGGPLIDGYPSGGPQGEGDLAPDPIQHVLPQVIEATNRVLIGNGDLDMIIITNVSQRHVTQTESMSNGSVSKHADIMLQRARSWRFKT